MHLLLLIYVEYTLGWRDPPEHGRGRRGDERLPERILPLRAGLPHRTKYQGTSRSS